MPVYICKCTNELYHHGIKGQKWGVRNGPPYPLRPNTISNGNATLLKNYDGPAYFISTKDIRDTELKPRIPDNYFTQNGYEDNETPRVSFAPSIDKCLAGLSQNVEGKTFNVYSPVDISSCAVYKPNAKAVPDSKITDELWIVDPVQIKKVGTIKVTGNKGTDGKTFAYGDKTATLYDDWTYEELEHSELYHYGIKGQKWGVRRYQNPDGSLTAEGKQRYSDKVIKKGTNLYRVSDASENDLYNGFYASIDPNDRNKYLDTYAKQMLSNGKQVIEKILLANTDIRIPNHKKSTEIMREALDNSNIKTDTERLNTLKKYFNDDISNENNASDKLYRKAIKELDIYSNTGKVGNNLYDAINIAQADRRAGIIQDISRNFYDSLNTQGYGAVIDLNDYKYGVMKANNPLIVTNAGNVSISQIRAIKHTDTIGSVLIHHGIKGQTWYKKNL